MGIRGSVWFCSATVGGDGLGKSRLHCASSICVVLKNSVQMIAILKRGFKIIWFKSVFITLYSFCSVKIEKVKMYF